MAWNRFAQLSWVKPDKVILKRESQLSRRRRRRLARPFFLMIEGVPFEGELPEKLHPGHMIAIDGGVLSDASRFSVDLVCGSSANADIALHFNPRFDQNLVVRNCRFSGKWGEEEISGYQKNPFHRGEDFYLYIFSADDEFMMAVNGIHFCSFAYRVSLVKILSLHVSGDIQVFQIEHRCVDVYPTPGSSSITIPVPTLSCPTNLVGFCQHIIKPDVPFIGDFPSGLEVGQRILIIGRLKILPYCFYVNLQKGKQVYPHPTVALHFNPRFREGHIVVRNTWTKGSWGSEERNGESPFVPGKDFVLQIVCNKDYYEIHVNDKQFTKFKHRMELNIIDTILIQGDVQVKDIYIR